MYATRIHESTISRLVPEVCDAIYKNLKSIYLKTPTNEETWSKIADNFNELWQFPHCLGAIDGRHITFRPPRSAGSYYYNYKGDNSIILLGMCNAHYQFTYINIDLNGRIKNGGVYKECNIGKSIRNNCLNFPALKSLPGRSKECHTSSLEMTRFPSDRLLKPYPLRGMSHSQRIFNYRLSSVRRMIKNSFGILANRFRTLLNPINLTVDKVEKITLAAVILHNYLIIEGAPYYTKENMKGNLVRVGRQGGNKSTTLAQSIRKEFEEYFISPADSVPWQKMQ